MPETISIPCTCFHLDSLFFSSHETSILPIFHLSSHTVFLSIWKVFLSACTIQMCVREREDKTGWKIKSQLCVCEEREIDKIVGSHFYHFGGTGVRERGDLILESIYLVHISMEGWQRGCCIASFASICLYEMS